ncbi:MAG: hypothetical protein WB709_00590 [Solirubrobacteraceae bacterium]
MRTIPTAPVAAGTLIAGYAVAVSTGSRPLGGVVLLIGGLWCARIWMRRHGPRMAMRLVGVGLFAFVISHLLALAIGAWPAVLVVAAVMAVAAWIWADSREHEQLRDGQLTDAELDRQCHRRSTKGSRGRPGTA